MNFQEFDLFSVFSQVKVATNKEQYSAEEQDELIEKAIINLGKSQSEFKENFIFDRYNQDINIPLKQNINPIQNTYNNLIDQKELSDTVSLSFISDKIQQLNIQDCFLWFEDFKQYGKLFKPLQRFRNFIKTNKFDSVLSNNFKISIYSSQDTKLYSGFNVIKKDWIVVKEQIIPQELLLSSAQQFIVHDQIYQLYPDSFVQLLLPVYIEEQIESNEFKFTSQLEYGETNLYNYSQQNQIQDLEYQLIFTQIYKQINLLHKHNIAHRDIKPQNIIYFENKGWLLCDFGDSIKYQNVNGIYNIRGTYSFLQPYLKQLSTIQGISLKQNLYENDIYALAITLTIIKYQIKHQDEIQEYLEMSEDIFIQQLIKNPNQNIDNQLINEIPFIKTKTQLMNKEFSLKQIGFDEIFSFIEVLRHIEHFNNLNQDFKIKIIKLIDETLAQKGQYFHETNIICYTRITKYIKELKHIIKYRYLRQSKYWKYLFQTKLAQKKSRTNKISYIINMYHLGLTDTTLYYARQFINNDYDFLVHIILMIILLRMRQYDLLVQEYNLILTYRDFKQMNPEEFDFFTYLTLGLIQWDQLSNEDVKFIQYNANIILTNFDPTKFQQEQYCNKEFSQSLVKNLISIFDQSIQKQDLIQIAFNFIEYLSNNINITVTLDIIEYFKENVKYTCTTYHWQKLITQQTQIMFDIRKTQIKKYLKEINYVLLFNSESKMQFQLLKILKLLNLSKQGIRKFTIYQKIQKQIRDIIFHSNFITLNFYIRMIIREFLVFNFFLIKEAKLQQNQGNYYKYQFQTVAYMGNRENLISFFTEGEKIAFIKLIERIFIQTLNYRRYSQLYKLREKKQQIKNSLINYSLQNDFKTELSLKMFKPLEKYFMLNHYIFRK